ncbi:hypothetical protein B296_00011727 [Ensete ventricosum]|uniref:Uncharacterized protein n=1 Tax=Ensete ventricosum TaxID=4639 RepID=A0A426ZVR3_ENSVE|nr:hypothetical protein B296_00011727 [Ensete ventricosum]
MPGRSTSIWNWILSNMAAAGSGEEEVPSTSFMTRRQRKDDGALGRGDCNGNTSTSKHGRADLARKIDDREEADNSAVGRGRGPRLLRLSGLQGQMRAATSVGCDIVDGGKSCRMQRKGYAEVDVGDSGSSGDVEWKEEIRLWV